MRAFVDEEACTACGLCEDTCPEVFEIADDIAEVIADPVPPDAEDTALEAAENCPTEAIQIEE
ncbi:MAG: ferredoxin [Deltaproteobacteria bacterium]|nr:ferredoxin [Deltaproteobacteria bacterium]